MGRFSSFRRFVATELEWAACRNPGLPATTAQRNPTGYFRPTKLRDMLVLHRGRLSCSRASPVDKALAE